MKRSFVDCCYDVLRAVKTIHRPTQLMQTTNINWVSLHICIDYLVALGALRLTMNGKRREYDLTSKGMAILIEGNAFFSAIAPPESMLGYIEAIPAW